MTNTDIKKTKKSAGKSIDKKPQKESTKKSGKKDIEKPDIKSNPDKPKKKKTQILPLNERQRIFCREYIKTGNGKQSVIKAGYSARTAEVTASKFLREPKVVAEIERLREKKEKKAIMDAQEVMELFSAVARGEIKDQFGLDATLADRLKAMNEIAKRTIDIDNRIKGIPDGNVVIKVDWRKS